MRIFVFLGLLSLCLADESSFELRMPSIRPQTDDLTLCFSVKIEQPIYITGFNPLANKSINHHIIVYGCPENEDDTDNQQIEKDNAVWNCGEMAEESPDADVTYEKAPICTNGQPPTIVYAWAMGAPSFKLPARVSYQVGTKAIRYLVLQQHYKDTSIFRTSNAVDKAGVEFTTVPEPTEKLAGIFLLASTDGILPPKQTVNFEIACRLVEPQGMKLIPFAYRTHTHSNGLVNSGYRIRNGQWTEIGRQNPQLPQTFYDVSNAGIDIATNDILAVRCTMFNNGEEPVTIGGTQHDEMCNFYIYYYSNANGPRPTQAFCQNAGPPQWSWQKFDDGNLSLSNMPTTVSEVPPPPAGVEPMMHDHHHGSSSHGGSISEHQHDLGNMKVAQESPAVVVAQHIEEEDDQQLENEDTNSEENEDENADGTYYRSAYNYDDDPYANSHRDDDQFQQEQAGFLAAALGKK